MSNPIARSPPAAAAITRGRPTYPSPTTPNVHCSSPAALEGSRRGAGHRRHGGTVGHGRAFRETWTRTDGTPSSRVTMAPAANCPGSDPRPRCYLRGRTRSNSLIRLWHPAGGGQLATHTVRPTWRPPGARCITPGRWAHRSRRSRGSPRCRRGRPGTGRRRPLGLARALPAPG